MTGESGANTSIETISFLACAGALVGLVGGLSFLLWHTFTLDTGGSLPLPIWAVMLVYNAALWLVAASIGVSIRQADPLTAGESTPVMRCVHAIMCSFALAGMSAYVLLRDCFGALELPTVGKVVLCPLSCLTVLGIVWMVHLCFAPVRSSWDD